jgi:predicted negative regulator of RcsB-dependent stress response
MKKQERHHLKQNEFVAGVASVTDWYQQHKNLVTGIVGAIVVAVVLTGSYVGWQNRSAERAGELMGVAMTIYQAPIVPPSSVPGAVQQPGSYPSEKARYEAALKAFEDVANSYGSSPSGIAARYHAAETLYSLGRLNDAHQAYQQVIDKGGSTIYGSMAKLGLASTMLAEGQSDQAIKTYEDLAAVRDSVVPVDGVLMQLAKAYAQLGKKSEARTTFKRVVDELPESPYVESARQQMTLLG